MLDLPPFASSIVDLIKLRSERGESRQVEWTMIAFPAELALLNIQGKISKDDRGYMPLGEAWLILRDMVARGEAPDDLGDDVAKWAEWIDHEYTRLHRIARGVALFRFEGPATATGKFVNRSGDDAFARIVIEVAPKSNNLQLVIDTSRCTFPYSYQLDAAEKESYFAAAAAGIQDYATRNRLVGTDVSVLEIHVHPVDSRPLGLQIAAGRAMQEAVAMAGKVAL